MRPTQIIDIATGDIAVTLRARVVYHLAALDWYDRLQIAQDNDEASTGDVPRESMDLCIELIRSEVVGVESFARDGVSYDVPEDDAVDELVRSVRIDELVGIAMGVLTGGQRTEGNGDG
jgi:hypothetical protein